jgi:pimeloyl-ACP methyl ester carboxylesterase
MMVKSPDPGIEIYVRNKRPADMTSFRLERTLLYVHGATYPASTAFDLPLDGQSWMDYIAARGYDVYLLDIRGYGKSSRPKEMSEDPKANLPIVRGDTAIKDIGTVVDFILARIAALLARLDAGDDLAGLAPAGGSRAARSRSSACWWTVRRYSCSASLPAGPSLRASRSDCRRAP